MASDSLVVHRHEVFMIFSDVLLGHARECKPDLPIIGLAACSYMLLQSTT